VVFEEQTLLRPEAPPAPQPHGPCPRGWEVRGAPWGGLDGRPLALEAEAAMLRAQAGRVGRPCTHRPRGSLWEKQNQNITFC